jgi:hypothetical protein
MQTRLNATHSALTTLADENLRAPWSTTLRQLADDDTLHGLLIGRCTRCYSMMARSTPMPRRHGSRDIFRVRMHPRRPPLGLKDFSPAAASCCCAGAALEPADWQQAKDHLPNVRCSATASAEPK